MQRLLTGNTFEKLTFQYQELLDKIDRKLEWDDNDEYQLISVRRRSGGLFHRDTLFGHQIKTKNLRTAKSGDFLISKMQILHGASGVTIDEFAGMKISGSYIALVSKDESLLDIEYFNWYSKLKYFYHQTYISSYGVHIEKMTFNFKAFMKQTMTIPSLQDQRRIIKILNHSQSEIGLLQKKKKELDMQKKELMQRLLTGKTRVRV